MTRSSKTFMARKRNVSASTAADWARRRGRVTMRRSLLLGLAIVVGIVILAYGFTVTQVDLTELGSATRQESLARIMRALARPDFFVFEQEEFQVETPIYVPCPAGGAAEPTIPQSSEPYMVVSPPCAEPGATVTVEGFNFAPNTSGPLNFIPPSNVSLQIGRIETDRSGHFNLTVKLRDRASDEAQLLRAITRRSFGLPQLSQNGIDTIDKIIETVFMALLATIFGTLLAIPVSFFAARNLMRTVTSPLASIALSIIAVPVGALLGATLARGLAMLSDQLTTSLLFNVGSLLVAPLLVWGTMRWTWPQAQEAAPARGEQWRPVRWAAMAGMVLLVILTLYLVSEFAVYLGQAAAPALGAFGFLGDFLANLGGILQLILLPVCALLGAGVLSSMAGRVGQWFIEQAVGPLALAIHLVLAAIAGATLAALIGGAIAWFYSLSNLGLTLYGPALVGAAAGLLLALRLPARSALPIGLAIYTVTRTVLNALRSVEALIMVIVFAVWVGIGPFAGVLALGLHTVAALAKLYSEQVENIMTGPLEAILASGANRLQMIVYAVIPQIVPPYISFTMYRWDINVRMSTIIGFAGGGGIGFLLQQNINLLNYRAASAQILAIAVVVSLMDYLSSALRQRAV